MEREELDIIIERHRLWLDGKEGGEMADLSGAYIRGFDLENADLRKANLIGCNLRGANLEGADLSNADLGSSNLSGAKLQSANLSSANMTNATLRGSDFRGSDLTDADLSNADLFSADLSNANLKGTNLSNANLLNTNFGKNRVLQIGPSGSRKDYLVYKFGPDLDEMMAGCWKGIVDDFDRRVERVHGNNKFGVEYQIIVTMLYALREQWEKEER